MNFHSNGFSDSYIFVLFCFVLFGFFCYWTFVSDHLRPPSDIFFDISQHVHAICDQKVGAKRGVTVSASAFLACHQCQNAGSSLGAFSGWHFAEARRQGFSAGTAVSSSPSLVNGSANRIKHQ